MFASAFALVPLIVVILAIYAFFSIAIDVRKIRRSLERRQEPVDR